MSRRPSFSARLASWLVMGALLLKAAVPMLATASAHAQGKALVEVCTVYGVATVALADTDPPPPADGGMPHAADHCALSAVLAWAAPQSPPSPPLAVPATVPAMAWSMGEAAPPDASGRWIARHKQGPPPLA